MSDAMRDMQQAPVPAVVAASLERAERNEFRLSCEPTVGRLLAVLAGATPPSGRILELGTGAGVGLSWIVHGLGSRTDVAVVTVERDAEMAAMVGDVDWPAHVRLVVGEAEEVLPSLGVFDLIFADAEGGKWSGLDLTTTALRPGAILVVDDMDASRYDDERHRPTITRVRNQIVSDRRLVAAELFVSSGIILATRCHDGVQ